MRIGESDKLSMPALQQAQSIPIMLEAGSAIQFGDLVQYGTIKRIEEDPILNREIADVETVSYLEAIQLISAFMQVYKEYTRGG